MVVKGPARRAERPERIVATVGVVGALLLTVGYFATDSIAGRVLPVTGARALPPAPQTSLLSSRRTPSTLSFLTRTGRLRRSLTAFSGSVPDGSCLRVDWLGQTMTKVNSDVALSPASTTKILVAAVALEVLGANHQFTTQVLAPGGFAGGIASDLYLVGGGDPVLVRSEYPGAEKYPTINGTSLEVLADRVVAAGITQVSGGIVVDDSRFDSERFVPTWPADFRGSEAGPLGALMVNDGSIIGQPLKGDDPAISAGIELRTLLLNRGVQMAREPRRDVLVSGAQEVARIDSSSLSGVLREMLTNSDNNTAELVVKEIGFVKTGKGSTAAGLGVVMETLKRWTVDAKVSLNDGSGLTAANRIPCDVLNSILSRFSADFPNLMSVAGTNGTLRDAFKGTPMEGRLVGKTGTLSGVKGLAGYLPLANSEPVVFSFLMNKSGIDNQGEYRPIWYGLGDALNRARAVPTADQLAP